MKKHKCKNKHAVARVKLVGIKMLKCLPGLQKEAELERIAKQINKCHAQIEADAKVVLDAGNHAIGRAIECGNFLRKIKTALKHGEFESWCKRHLRFKIRKAQYYMALSQRHSERDVLKLNPQNLRQAFIYSGLLPEDSQTIRRKGGKFDELGYVRKAVSRLVVQLRNNAASDPEKLLKEIEPLLQWRERLIAMVAEDKKQATAVDIQTEVVRPEVEKRNVLRFSTQPGATPPPQNAPNLGAIAALPSTTANGTLK